MADKDLTPMEQWKLETQQEEQQQKPDLEQGQTLPTQSNKEQSVDLSTLGQNSIEAKLSPENKAEIANMPGLNNVSPGPETTFADTQHLLVVPGAGNQPDKRMMHDKLNGQQSQAVNYVLQERGDNTLMDKIREETPEPQQDIDQEKDQER